MEKSKFYTVSELALLIEKALDKQPLNSLWVRGEISNFKRHTSGHLYFSVKDSKCSIRSVMFKSRTWSLNFEPWDGMDCLVRGYVSLYSKETIVQLYVEEIIPAGKGLQFAALEELKKKLASKGFFAPERKRPLPFLPRKVGVVTSPAGAAIKDIYQVIQRRYPGMPVVLYPVQVQGQGAPEGLARGITELGKLEDLDLIILARGGGSSDDLEAFNTEVVAEAVFFSPKPVISAVGHEIDYTIADLVADVRAATPSVAGELAVPIKDEVQKNLEKMRERLNRIMENNLDREKMRLAFLASSTIIKKPERWMAKYLEDLALKETRLFKVFENNVRSQKQELAILAEKLAALSPLATLARGYSICKDSAGRIIADSRQVGLNEAIFVRLNRGSLECLVRGKVEERNEQPGRKL